MTDHAWFEDRLDDFVDGLLDGRDRARFDRHAADCATCARKLEAQRSLLRAAADLRVDVAPSRNLLPGIRRAVRQHPERLPLRERPWWLGLAASLLIAGGLAVVYGLGRLPVETGAGGGAPPGTAQPATLNDDFGRVELEYERAAEQLLASIEARRDRLPPEIVETLDRNLAIIDAAIAEIHAALESAPPAASSTELLAAMHQQRIQLLWRVSRLSS